MNAGLPLIQSWAWKYNRWTKSTKLQLLLIGGCRIDFRYFKECSPSDNFDEQWNALHYNKFTCVAYDPNCNILGNLTSRSTCVVSHISPTSLSAKTCTQNFLNCVAMLFFISIIEQMLREFLAIWEGTKGMWSNVIYSKAVPIIFFYKVKWSFIRKDYACKKYSARMISTFTIDTFPWL